MNKIKMIWNISARVQSIRARVWEMQDDSDDPRLEDMTQELFVHSVFLDDLLDEIPADQFPSFAVWFVDRHYGSPDAELIISILEANGAGHVYRSFEDLLDETFPDEIGQLLFYYWIEFISEGEPPFGISIVTAEIHLSGYEPYSFSRN